jgi:N-acetylglucosaminylphosphatidylinositol deacetylase
VKPYVVEHGITTVSIATQQLPHLLDIHISSQILTFDEKGISLHPNHMSIPHGLIHLLSTQLSHPIPKLYTLISLPPFAKFQGPLAPVLAKYDLVLQTVWHFVYAYLFGMPSEVPTDERVSVPVFVSGAREYLTALKSMYEHRSQLVWFRWLYVVASRYMWVNEWLEVRIPSAVTVERV